jgi:AcrR family transcriptional regulator
MRRIAQELDVWPMSLYRYFHDKDALLEALAEAAADKIVLPSRRASPRSQMRQLLVTIKKTLQDHPGGQHLRLIGLETHPAAARTTRRALAILGDGGLDASEAKTAWKALVLYAAGAAAAQAGEEFTFGLDRFLDGLNLNAPARRPNRAVLQAH